MKNLTLKEVASKLKNKEISSVELTEYYLKRIKELNPKLNAYIEVFTEEALAQARESDLRYASGKELGPIDGMPIAIKDNMMIEGRKVTAGSKILESFTAAYDATVIKKLRENGAVFLGRTNMDEFAMGSSTETSFYGPTKNPWDPERVPGGSSGGSAAAVAGDLCLAALGSDTGGSIRQPASFCGVVGMKPTYGAVSRYGLISMASSLDQIGPMTKTAEDAEILFNIIAGHDEKDSTSVKQNLPLRQGYGGQAKIKIGIPKEYFGEGLDPKVREVVEKAIETFKENGAEIKEISLPNFRYGFSCYYIIMPVEVSSNLARYDGIKYGYKSKEAENLSEVYLKTRLNGFGSEVKRRIILGAYASSAGYIGKFYNKAQKVRALIKKDFDKAFSEVDFILGPVAPTTAFRLSEKISDPLTMYLSVFYTLAVNLAGVAAVSIPAGLADNLPVGLQIIGPQFSDLEILNLAKTFEGEQDGLSSPAIN